MVGAVAHKNKMYGTFVLEDLVREGRINDSRELRRIKDFERISANDALAKAEQERLLRENIHSARVQMSSWEPNIEDTVYLLRKEAQDKLHPDPSMSVYRNLLGLPARSWDKVRIDGGLKLEREFAYFMRFEQCIDLINQEQMFWSPKSSLGRIFPRIQVFADYASSPDELFAYERPGKRDLWVYVKPQKFEFVIREGELFTQGMILPDPDCKVTMQELTAHHEEDPIVFDVTTGKPIPSEHLRTSSSGLYLSADIRAEDSEGVALLRVRDDAEVIDLKERNHYEIERNFDPIVRKEIRGRFEVSVNEGDACLWSSAEVTKIPDLMAAEMRRESRVFEGTNHEAGWGDNSFSQAWVFEGIMKKAGVIRDRQPTTSLDFFHTTPARLYGEESGSTYGEQKGPRPAKQFKFPSWSRLAKKNDKLNKRILTQDANVFRAVHSSPGKFAFAGETTLSDIERIIEDPIFHDVSCETKEELLQPIPYVLFFNGQGQVFVFQRANDIEQYTEERLYDKVAIGVSGHIEEKDGPAYIQNNIERKVLGQTGEVKISGEYTSPKFMGTLLCDDMEVDRVHIGLIYASLIQGSISTNDSSLSRGGMSDFDKVSEMYPGKELESWTSVLTPILPEIYEKLRNE